MEKILNWFRSAEPAKIETKTEARPTQDRQRERPRDFGRPRPVRRRDEPGATPVLESARGDSGRGRRDKPRRQEPRLASRKEEAVAETSSSEQRPTAEAREGKGKRGRRGGRRDRGARQETRAQTTPQAETAAQERSAPQVSEERPAVAVEARRVEPTPVPVHTGISREIFREPVEQTSEVSESVKEMQTRNEPKENLVQIETDPSKTVPLVEEAMRRGRQRPAPPPVEESGELEQVETRN